MFEILHSFFVILGSFSGGKSSQIATLSSLGILLARVQTVFAGFRFANHRPPEISLFGFFWYDLPSPLLGDEQ